MSKVINEKTQSDELSNLSERLLHALRVLGVTQTELARRINVKQQAIQYLCSSKAKKSGFTYEIADALNISSIWLGSGVGSMIREEKVEVKLAQNQRCIPVLERSQIVIWMCNEKNVSNSLITVEEWMLINSDVGEKGYAIKLHDKSMYPRFEQNTVLIVNPEKSPQDGEFVLVKLDEMNEIVFRQYEISDNNIFLKPLNTAMYKGLKMTEKDKILGVLVEARWQV